MERRRRLMPMLKRAGTAAIVVCTSVGLIRTESELSAFSNNAISYQDIAPSLILQNPSMYQHSVVQTTGELEDGINISDIDPIPRYLNVFGLQTFFQVGSDYTTREWYSLCPTNQVVAFDKYMSCKVIYNSPLYIDYTDVETDWIFLQKQPQPENLPQSGKAQIKGYLDCDSYSCTLHVNRIAWDPHSKKVYQPPEVTFYANNNPNAFLY